MVLEVDHEHQRTRAAATLVENVVRAAIIVVMYAIFEALSNPADASLAEAWRAARATTYGVFMAVRIVAVDDEESLLKVVTYALEQEGCHTRVVNRYATIRTYLDLLRREADLIAQAAAEPLP